MSECGACGGDVPGGHGAVVWGRWVHADAKVCARIGVKPGWLAPTDPRDAGCLCQGCGRRYRVDVLVPDEVWEKIRPTGDAAGGLLCGTCILSAIEGQGFAAYRLEPT